MGLISAIGDSVEENRDSLQHQRSGISHIQFYQTAYAGKLPTAEVRHPTEFLINKLFNRGNPSITRTALLALMQRGSHQRQRSDSGTNFF
jgi:hypothetical protein